jgi:hypothetical protein
MYHEHNELTRGAFVNYIKDYIKQLLQNPLKADIDDFLKQHNFTNEKVLNLLLDKPDKDDDFSAILIKQSKIKDNGSDENGKRLPDTFEITYKAPRKDILRKIKKLYGKLYEYAHVVDNNIGFERIDEDGEGCGDIAGATNAASSGQFTTKLNNKPISRTFFVTQEQMDSISKVIKEESVMNTQIGDFGYDVPMNVKKNDPTLDHKNMMEKSWAGEVEEDINIKPENKGKFTQTKKRTGKSTEELTHSKNKLTRKRAIFAQNAKKMAS